MEIVPNNNASPFDAIKQTRPDGSEFWSARDLMDVMKYTRWENFMTGVKRAMKTAENQGQQIGKVFHQSVKKSFIGRPKEDYELSRYAAYLVAMNGDPNMPSVAAAQSYFAIQTRVAEVAPVRELSGAELMAKALIEAQSVLAAKDERIAELEPKAETYDKVLTPEHTMNLTELSANLREHFPVNRNDVKAKLLEKGLLYQNVLKATAKAVDGGWAVQRPQGVHGGKERFQPRFTTKTLEWLLDEFAPLEDVA